ncbi:unnamed protein product [Gadus morhua 'NCC']
MRVTAVLTCCCIVYLYIGLAFKTRMKKPLEQVKKCYEMIHQPLEKKETKEQKRKEHEEVKKSVGGAAGEGTPGGSSTPLLSPEPPAGLETSIPPAPSSETQPAGLETSIPPAPSSETQPAEETTPLKSSESPAPTGDQQECTITIPDGTMDDHDDDQSLGPARPSSPKHNRSLNRLATPWSCESNAH